MATRANDNYTDPALRERLKEEIKASDKGGKAGQWSARKSQLLTHEYAQAGGGYKTEERTEAQKHLHEWTEEEWQTRDGQPAERDGETARYLPKDAWDKMTPAEQRATDEKKREGSHDGHQYVANTEKAKAARKDATQD